MGMRNDASFIIAFVMSLWEHQSSFNPNLPIRLLIYFVHLYEKYIMSSSFNRFSRKLQRLPQPKLICFYNGTENQPEERILTLSDAFGSDDGDIEVRERMLNINYGHNKELMKFCGMLNEYSWFIDAIRRNQRTMSGLEQAIDAAIDEMPEEFELKKFLLAHRAEVKGMYLTEYNAEKERRRMLREGIEEGRAEGRAEGQRNEKERTVIAMLKEKLPLPLVAKISNLSEDVIRSIADGLGISLA